MNSFFAAIKATIEIGNDGFMSWHLFHDDGIIHLKNATSDLWVWHNLVTPLEVATVKNKPKVNS